MFNFFKTKVEVAPDCKCLLHKNGEIRAWNYACDIHKEDLLHEQRVRLGYIKEEEYVGLDYKQPEPVIQF